MNLLFVSKFTGCIFTKMRNTAVFLYIGCINQFCSVFSSLCLLLLSDQSCLFLLFENDPFIVCMVSHMLPSLVAAVCKACV